MGFLQDIRASRAPALAFVSMGMLWAAFAAQVPVLKDRIGASDAEFGMSFLISSLGAFSALWLSPRADRLFGAASLQVAVAAMALSFLLPGLATGLPLFVVAMLLASAASGVTDVLMNARVSEAETSTGRPLMNLNHALFSFAYAGAAVATGLARQAGIGPVGAYAGIVALIMLLCLFARAPHRQFVPEAEDRADAVLSGSGLVWLIGLVVLAAYFTEQSVEGWSALHLERTLGGSAAEGALGPAVLGLTMGFGRLFGQAIAARVSDIWMIAAACLVSAAGLALASVGSTLVLAYLGFGLLGLGISVVAPVAIAMAGRAVPESERVVTIGRVTIIGYSAYFIGPGIIGVTSERFGLPVAFLIVSVMLVAVAVVLVPMIAARLAR